MTASAFKVGTSFQGLLAQSREQAAALSRDNIRQAWRRVARRVLRGPSPNPACCAKRSVLEVPMGDDTERPSHNPTDEIEEACRTAPRAGVARPNDLPSERRFGRSEAVSLGAISTSFWASPHGLSR